MSPDHKRKLILAHTILSDNATQTGIVHGGLSLGARGCVPLAAVFGGLCAAGGESSWGAEADALREDDAGVIV